MGEIGDNRLGGSLGLLLTTQLHDQSGPMSSGILVTTVESGLISTADPSVPAPGVYTVNVCVVDSIGSETCANRS